MVPRKGTRQRQVREIPRRLEQIEKAVSRHAIHEGAVKWRPEFSPQIGKGKIIHDIGGYFVPLDMRQTNIDQMPGHRLHQVGGTMQARISKHGGRILQKHQWAKALAIV